MMTITKQDVKASVDLFKLTVESEDEEFKKRLTRTIQ